MGLDFGICIKKNALTKSINIDDALKVMVMIVMKLT